MKSCPQCARVLHAGAKTCDGCGHAFPVSAPAVKAQPTSAQILSGNTQPAPPRRQSVQVRAIEYLPHSKPGKPLSMRVQYTLGLSRVSEWVLPEHEGYAAERSAKWWRKHSTALNAQPPRTALEALARAQAGELRAPVEIVIEPDQRNPEFLRIVGRRFED